MVQTGGRVQLHHLVVLHCQVVTGSLQVGNLHEEARHQGLADVDVVVARRELCAGTPQVEAFHDADQLLAYVVRRLEGAEVDEVVVAPLGVFMVLLEGMVDVEQSQVVSVDVSEPHLGLVRGFLCLVGPHKTLIAWL